MRGYHHHRARFARRGYSLNGALWLIGLFFLFYTGHWWPGILILIGISSVLSAVLNDHKDETIADLNPGQPAPSGSRDPSPAPRPVIINLPPPSPAVTSNSPRFDLLPANCPRCGAPVRTNDVKWTGSHSAACAYCGSNLIAVKK